jgi:soluble lytic murein transglycosylase-like protein
MSITSMNARMGMAEKLDIPQLTKAVQDGTIPSFIGIPLIQEKMKERQAAGAMQPKAPPVAQQVLQQAMATEGVQALPSNMPQQYAQGGILHYAEGDLVDDDDYEEMLYDDQMSEAQKQIEQIRNQMMEDRAASPSYGGIDYTEAPNPQVEYQRTPTAEVAKVSKGTPSNFESMAVAKGRAHGVDESLVRHVMHKETGGLKDRANAVSPAGAIGVMQLMPATARGLGVRDPYDPEQNIEGGVKYLAQLQRKYQDPRLVAIAYNWGPGNTDKWLASGADISRLPRETRGYIQNLAEGGIVGLAGGGMEGVRINPYQDFRIPPVDDLEKQKALLERMRRIEQAKAAFSEMPKPAATVATPSAPAAMSPFERYIKPMFRAGSATSAAVNPAGIATLGGGALLSAGAANALSNATPEQREQLMGDIGSDTSIGAAIMNEAKPGGWSILGGKPTPAAVLPQTGAGAGRGKIGGPSAVQSVQNPAFNPSVTRASPYDIEDMEAGQGAGEAERAAQALVASQKQASTEKESDSGNDIQEIKNLLKQRGEGLSKQKDIDNYMSLLSAGLGMMGGTSPFAAANIGQGAQAGISHALQAQRSRAAEENALLSGRLGLYKYQQSAEANKQNKEYLQEHRKELNRLKELGLTDAKAKALAEQELKRTAEYDRVLSGMERNAQTMAVAKLKGAFTEQEKAKAEADALASLYRNPRYREAYFARNKFYPDLSEAPSGNKKISFAEFNK